MVVELRWDATRSLGKSLRAFGNQQGPAVVACPTPGPQLDAYGRAPYGQPRGARAQALLQRQSWHVLETARPRRTRRAGGDSCRLPPGTQARFASPEASSTRSLMAMTWGSRTVQRGRRAGVAICSFGKTLAIRSHDTRGDRRSASVIVETSPHGELDEAVGPDRRLSAVEFRVFDQGHRRERQQGLRPLLLIRPVARDKIKWNPLWRQKCAEPQQSLQTPEHSPAAFSIARSKVAPTLAGYGAPFGGRAKRRLSFSW